MHEARPGIMSGSNGVNMIEVTSCQAAFRQVSLNRASDSFPICSRLRRGILGRMQ